MSPRPTLPTVWRPCLKIYTWETPSWYVNLPHHYPKLTQMTPNAVTFAIPKVHGVKVKVKQRSSLTTQCLTLELAVCLVPPSYLQGTYTHTPYTTAHVRGKTEQLGVSPLTPPLPVPGWRLWAGQLFPTVSSARRSVSHCDRLSTGVLCTQSHTCLQLTNHHQIQCFVHSKQQSWGYTLVTECCPGFNPLKSMIKSK